ncbi:PLP-dependent aminotransferase family protein [Leucobacter chromiireducens]|nr:PLP-dependent aminotransferase family protein [Leucobacter chromiireducens]
MQQSSTDRIITELERWISGAAAGAQLPSGRELATRFGAGPVTVQRAMHTLAERGLIESRPGVGTFVRRIRAQTPADYSWQTAALAPGQASTTALPHAQRSVAPGTIELHSGYPVQELLPAGLVRAAAARAARTPDALTRAPAAGLPALQAWFAAELGTDPESGTVHAAREVSIVPGSQSALSSVFRALVGAGGALAIESPSYWGALLAAHQVSVRLIPIASGPAGPDPEELARALHESGARAFYAQPSFANPQGGQWGAERGRVILDVLREHRAFLIEDDWARDFGITPPTPPLARADRDGRVVYIRSLTKSLSPAVRVGAVIARGPARDRILADLVAETMYVSPLLQSIAHDVVTSSGWRTHLRALPELLRHRRDALLDALATHAPAVHVAAVPQGGLNVWAQLPAGTNAQRTVRDCEARGLAVAAGDAWFPAEPPAPHLRLNFAGPEPERYPDAARILGEVLTAQLG